MGNKEICRCFNWCCSMDRIYIFQTAKINDLKDNIVLKKKEMDINQARAEAERKMASVGYVHPTTSVCPSTAPQYKSYSKDNDNCYKKSAPLLNQYSNIKSNSKPTINISVCPTCNEPATYMCDCELADNMCKNGHVWYVTENGKIVAGDPHENE